MQHFDANEMIDLYSALIPLAILRIEDDKDRAFLTEAYGQYKALMYKTALGFFPQDYAEVEEAVDVSIERMCKYCKKFQAVACNQRAAYVVRLVENVCRTRIRTILLQRDRFAFSIDDERYAPIPSAEDVQDTVFSHLCADDLLKSFDELSMRERELIRMRHVDGMTFADMAKEMQMSEGAVRTALTRAKQHLEKLGATRRKEFTYNAE